MSTDTNPEVPEAEVADRPVGLGATKVDIKEQRTFSAGGGATLGAVVVAIVCFGVGAWAVATESSLAIIAPVAFIIGALLLSMIRIINPGHTLVIQLFGRYLGTCRRTGLVLVPPLTTTKKVSVRVRNFETEQIKVNDFGGNPVNIASIIVWQIADTAKATFCVETVDEFIASQAESALRHVATSHPYDGGTNHHPSLSGSTDLVSRELADEVAARVSMAGIEIIEARISSLSYAPEIAQAMLQRQQAAAIVDARETIVDGAVSMVDSALKELEAKQIVDLDPERRAAMVSNLLVVLCSDNNVQPMVNTGSLYS
ncbi:SPFH domain-containing protein [Corynebacterium uberis]|uniref:SPFH domain-containing protein n=1 Tax=Corynebacterium uberis TaxID=2883169 RepID=UPI001D09C5D8|nr:SPFH domain-containing protein [Corynebacterium uberis]UDL73569.1 SPFH domain-containing protein [Corynebacterium uberis]UDL75551.1 SPFH domain-containing protein [Corynebacterium uberis]UDL77764.1 SPFH domain-containing protein [Corynebacterium uberis]UDL80047.1 SPFH domain-containing protein [Corynebacterium uberis]UDL82180.1 SPFH domain-containing protein [Corynebacterium uberis]